MIGKIFKTRDLFDFNKWRVTIKGDDALEDLFGQDIAYFTVFESITLNDYIVFWYNKKLYILKNDDFICKNMKYQDLLDIKDKITFRLLYNGIYCEEKYFEARIKEENIKNICTAIYVNKTLKQMKFKINLIKERILYWYLKFKFWQNK
jgi:hypothetical protein